MASESPRFLTIPLWQAVKRTYATVLKGRWEKIMRNPLGKRIVYATGVFIAVYILVVGITSIWIYHYKTYNGFTRAIEHIFPYPAAIVNHQIIYLSRYRVEVAARTYYSSMHNLNATPAETSTFAINQLEDRELYAQALSAHNIILSQSDLDSKLQDIYSQVGGQEKLAAFLSEQYGPGVTVNLFKTWLQEAAVESAVQDQLLTRVTLKHILVAVPNNATPDQIETARQKALTIKASITDNSQFGGVAKEQSDDIASRDKDGDFGTTNRGDDAPVLSADFENAIFSLPVGKISDPIRTPYGWHIVLIESRVGSIDMSKKAFTDNLHKTGSIRTYIGL